MGRIVSVWITQAWRSCPPYLCPQRRGSLWATHYDAETSVERSEEDPPGFLPLSELHRNGRGHREEPPESQRRTQLPGGAMCRWLQSRWPLTHESHTSSGLQILRLPVLERMDGANSLQVHLQLRGCSKRHQCADLRRSCNTQK